MPTVVRGLRRRSRAEPTARGPWDGLVHAHVAIRSFELWPTRRVLPPPMGQGDAKHPSRVRVYVTCAATQLPDQVTEVAAGAACPT
jgi:hypothetical protein